ncbi:MAG: hypothetical protein IJ137_05905 [Eubacterium sp.]|nr:hypothetical protein [Eubacterium sp.]
MNTLQDKIIRKISRKANEKRDLSPLYADRELMEQILEEITASYAGQVDYVASPESLGFILGSMAAARLKVGFIPIRNRNLYGLSPTDAISAPYIDHRDEPRALQIRTGMIPKNSRVLLVDDWVETAATIHACAAIVEDSEAKVAGIASIGATRNEKTSHLLQSGQLKCAVEL